MSNFDDYSYPYYAYATNNNKPSNSCVGGTKDWHQCDGKSTVFYNGCCRLRNSPCGNGGYLAQTGNKQYGTCIVPEARAKKNKCQSMALTGAALHECTPEETWGDIGKGLPIGGKESLIDKVLETYPIGGEGGIQWPNFGGGGGDGGGAPWTPFTGGCFGIGIPNVIPMMGEAGCLIIPAIIAGLVLLMVLKR